MRRLAARIVLPLLAALLALLLLTGCGGSESVTNIDGSSATISKPMLDHWMRAVVATDFRVSVLRRAPTGLASEPANYPQCVAAAKTVVPRSSSGQLSLTEAEIERKCHQLYQAIRNQTMSYLLSAQWTMLEAKEEGVPLSEAELRQEFLRYQTETFKTTVRYESYLKERRLTLSDVLYQLRRNVLVSRLLPKFQAKVRQTAGDSQAAYVKLALERYRARIAKTRCKAGYVMEDCRDYHPPAKELPSPSVILEGFARAVRNT
jgi:hypothetical protein